MIKLPDTAAPGEQEQSGSTSDQVFTAMSQRHHPHWNRGSYRGNKGSSDPVTYMQRYKFRG